MDAQKIFELHKGQTDHRATFAAAMMLRNLYATLKDDLNKLGNSLFYIANNIMKITDITQQLVPGYQQILDDIIICSLQHNYQVGFDALNIIFNPNSEFYKKADLDLNLNFPLGRQYPIIKYIPSVGEQCDIVRPYVTATSYCGWVRCTVLQIQDNKYTFQYLNSAAPITTQHDPFFAPLGTRTIDYEWRINLEIGSKVEAQVNRVWYESTIIEVSVQNQFKKVLVSFRRFSDEGDRIDSHGQKYWGLGPNEDQWMDVLSPRIQQNGKMKNKRLCYYTASSEQILPDDNYDILFENEYNEKAFHGIMRPIYVRSLSYIRLMNTFANNKGFEKYFQILSSSSFNIDSVFYLQASIGQMTPLIPKMDINQYLPKVYQLSIKFIKENTKLLTPLRIDQFFYCIDTIGRRIFSLTEVYQHQNQLKMYIVSVFIKMNMEKQMLALKFIYELLNPKKAYSSFQQIQFDQFLVEQKMFEQIFQLQTHEQILSRTSNLLRYMIDRQIVREKQIDDLWSMAPQSDQRSRAIIQKIFSELASTMPIQYIEKLLDKILELKETDLTLDNLQLLRQLKNRQISPEYQIRILTYLWDIITTKSYNIKNNIQEEVEKTFKGFISRIKQPQIRMNVLDSMIKRLTETKKIINIIYLLKDFILSYPEKIQEVQNELGGESQEIEAPKTVSDAVSFLKGKQIYEKLLDLLKQTKKQQIIMQLLKFLGFLFAFDSDDVSYIIRPIFDRLGPSDILLEWIYKVMNKAHIFVEQLLTSSKIQGFSTLSRSGFEALTEMIIASNEKLKKLAIVTTSEHQVSSGTQTESFPSTQKSVAAGSKKTRHIYILVSPFELLGMKFLSNLLHVLKNSRVYDEAVKLIIKFIVELDDSIADKTLQYRKQFLNEIVGEIRQIINKNEINESIKSQIQVYINLFFELFSQTEKDGLCNIYPQYQKLRGETLTINFENTYPQIKEKRIDKFTLIVNQNDTVWRLKTKIAAIINENPNSIDVIKYVNSIDDGFNGKTLSSMFFYDQQGVKIAKKPPKQIPKHNIFNETQTELSERFTKIVAAWFNEFKNSDNLLTAEGFQNLAEIRWKVTTFRSSQSMNIILRYYDLTDKGGLNYEEFKTYILKGSRVQKNFAWRKIQSSGYQNNLLMDSMQSVTPNQTTLPRKILSCPEVYSLIFGIFKNTTFEAVQSNFYKLLSHLEIDQTTQQYIEQNIFSILEESQSIYQFCYAIEVLNSILSVNRQYFLQFWKKEGCVKVLQRMCRIMRENENIYKFQYQMKDTILPGLIKTINIYFEYLFSDTQICRYIMHSKINTVDLQDIDSKAKKFIEQQKVTNTKEKQQIKGQLVQICPQFDYRRFYEVGLTILHNLVQNFVSENSDFLPKLTNQLIKYLGSIALGKPELFNPITFIYAIKSQSLNYRRTSSNFIYLYLKFYELDHQNLLNQLFANMPSEIKHLYTNYFGVYQRIVKFYLDKYKQSSKNDEFLTNTANNLLDKLFSGISQKRTSLISDKMVLGILSAISNLLIKRSICEQLKHRKHQIMKKCLFFYEVQEKLQNLHITPEMLKRHQQGQHFPNYVICKTEQTRQVAYDIILKLHQVSAKDDPQFLHNFILPIIQQLPDQVRLTESRSLSVGLKNFGNTCYMNSMIQVLNAIEPFRNILMQAQQKSQLIKELKNTFSALFFSQRIDYAPKKVLQAFVPPINPGIQQDTTQFLNLLFDQLQTSLQKTQHKHLLDQIFKGYLIAQMICSSCGYKKENKQSFFSHSLQIQGKNQLTEALQHSHEGQIISDYLCDNCHQKCDMKKRNLLSDIPNILFLHLRRIVFNYDMFVNMKIHTRLHFPNQLNIQPYTKQGIELRESLGLEYLKNLSHNQEQMKNFEEMTLHGKQKDYYKLKLKGIIVHSGSADAGHYISIILNNKGTWYKYDDSRISVSTPSSFEKQCYGGAWTNDEWGGFGSSTNAYFLVYQRVVKHPLKIFKQPSESGKEEEQLIEYQSADTYNIKQHYKKVWLDNHNFMLETHLLHEGYSKQFIKFMGALIKQHQEANPLSNTLQILSELLYRVIIYSEETEDFGPIFSKTMPKDVVMNFATYIIPKKKKTFKLLFSFSHSVRRLVALYLSSVIMGTYMVAKNDDIVQKGCIALIGEYIDYMGGDIAQNWLRMNGFFTFIYLVLVSSETAECPKMWHFLIRKRLISRLICFILEKESPVKMHANNYSIGTQKNPVDSYYALKTIAFLVQHSYGMTGQNYELPKVSSQKLFHLNDNDIICLGYKPFYHKILTERQNCEDIAIIIQRLCIQNLPYSRMVIECLLDAIRSADQMRDLSFIALEIIRIKDEYWKARAEMLLGYGSPNVQDENLISYLEEDRFIYNSIGYQLSLSQCLLASAYNLREKNPLGCFYLLKAILEGCSISEDSFTYIIKQPAPNYYFSDYLDWAQTFLNFMSDFNKDSQIQQDRKETMKDLANIKEFKELNRDKIRVYQSIVTGKIQLGICLHSETIDNVDIKVCEYQTYCLESKPCHPSKQTLDKYLQNGRILKPVDKSSNILHFMKNPTNVIPLKSKPVQQEEEKQIMGLFQQDYPSEQLYPSLQKPLQTVKKSHMEKQPHVNSADDNDELPLINIEEKEKLVNYFTSIQIENNSNFTKIVKIVFKTARFKKTKQDLNYLQTIEDSFKVFRKSSKKLWFNRLNPDQPIKIEPFETTVEDFVAEKNEKNSQRLNWFKLYNYQVSEEEELLQKMEEEPVQKMAEEKKGKQEEIQISCPACTFINMPSNQECEICGSPLR